MKSVRSILMPTLIFVFAFVLVAGMMSTACAEEPTESTKIIDYGKFYQTYNEYHYPKGGRMFYLPRYHEVKFDVHNGKFFTLAYWPYRYLNITTPAELNNVNYKVFYYTPTGKLFGIRRIRYLDYNRYHSIPHNDRSPNYERLILRIQNNTPYNKDFMVKILDPVDPVKGTPIKGSKYRIILLD